MKAFIALDAMKLGVHAAAAVELLSAIGDMASALVAALSSYAETRWDSRKTDCAPKKQLDPCRPSAVLGPCVSPSRNGSRL